MKQPPICHNLGYSPHISQQKNDLWLQGLRLKLCFWLPTVTGCQARSTAPKPAKPAVLHAHIPVLLAIATWLRIGTTPLASTMLMMETVLHQFVKKSVSGKCFRGFQVIWTGVDGAIITKRFLALPSLVTDHNQTRGTHDENIFEGFWRSQNWKSSNNLEMLHFRKTESNLGPQHFRISYIYRMTFHV